MGRKTESLQHALIRQVEEKKNNQTSKSYRKNVKKFVAWAKENGGGADGADLETSTHSRYNLAGA